MGETGAFAVIPVDIASLGEDIIVRYLAELDHGRVRGVENPEQAAHDLVLERLRRLHSTPAPLLQAAPRLDVSVLRDLIVEVQKGNEHVLEIARQAVADANAIATRPEPQSLGPAILAAIQDLAAALRSMPAPQVTVQANIPPTVVNVPERPVDVHVKLEIPASEQTFRIEKDEQGRATGITKTSVPRQED